MQRALHIAATTAVAILVPPLLVVGAFRIVANDWIVRFEYGPGGVAAEPGLTSRQRTELALTGLDAIRPGGRGVVLLREARLPDGEPAFSAREISHMDDVRSVARSAFTFLAVGVVGIAGLAVALAFGRGTRAIVPRGLRIGSVATLGIAAAAALVMVVAWESFFEGFHHVFFEGESWIFASTDTLIRLYPDRFWTGVGAWVAGLTVALALAVWALSSVWLGRVGPYRKSDPSRPA